MNDRSAYENCENVYYLPYRNVAFLYGEYDFYCKSNMIVERAKETTFRSAFTEVKKFKLSKNVKIRFSEGKGSFDKCDICSNADQLLHGRNKFSSFEIEVIRSYRRRHIFQQFEERVTLQNNIAKTYCLDEHGRPMDALFFMDGMTIYKGNTPKKGHVKSKGETSQITSRIIGVEVHCGPVHGTFLYYTDNLVSGGANTIIEIMRQSVLDLQDLLKRHTDNHKNPLDIPENAIFQFDNCSENKNKYVFTYISLLVQEGIFKKIEVYFLIVGHTHASIDQFFSILARRISSAYFIGSPLSLRALLLQADFNSNLSGSNKEKRIEKPLLVKNISVVYDMKKALEPLINKKIIYYPIPHKFVFEMFHSVCTMQYSIFSTHSVLLPRRPIIIPDFELPQSMDVTLEFLSLVGGKVQFAKECGLEDISNVFDNGNNNSFRVSLFYFC